MAHQNKKEQNSEWSCLSKPELTNYGFTLYIHAIPCVFKTYIQMSFPEQFCCKIRSQSHIDVSCQELHCRFVAIVLKSVINMVQRCTHGSSEQKGTYDSSKNQNEWMSYTMLMIICCIMHLNDSIITLCDTVFHWLATDRWFSPGTPVSSTKKTDHHDITEIFLKVALNTMTLTHWLHR
jgi:hypothetical protein